MAARHPARQQPESFAWTPDNQTWCEAQVAKYPEGRQASAVIPFLWRAQKQEGWVSIPAMETIAAQLGMPYIRVYEVASFYTMFNLTPVGKYFVQLCGTPPCALRTTPGVLDPRASASPARTHASTSITSPPTTTPAPPRRLG